MGTEAPGVDSARRVFWRRRRTWVLGGALIIALITVVGALLFSEDVRSALFGDDDPASYSAGLVATPRPASPMAGNGPTTLPTRPTPAPVPTVDPAAPTAPVEKLPAPEFVAPVCPAGEVVMTYNKMQLDGTAWTAGVVRNNSDTVVQVIGNPGAWGVDSAGVNALPVGGYFDEPVDELYPGDFVTFQITSAPASEEELAAVAEWRYTGAGDYLSARWFTIPECGDSAPIVVHVLN
ncbi:hypothetical protein [Microbacterium sp. NPDC056234]|uniref:hypothetical protein n=1 Tax=Microbacterium sp. NPDC056234 TaxID=3345757 RepID=UPI0035D7D2BC